MKLFLFFSLIFISTSVYSQDDQFIHVTTANDGSKVFVKYEGKVYDSKQFWLKMNNPSKTIKNKNGKLIKSGGGYLMRFFELNCSTKTYSASDGVEYNNSGKVVKKLYDIYNDRVIPGSVMDGVYEYVCSEFE